jgi:hypothetical protein
VLALVEIAVAFAIVFLAFGKDERPAPNEEHVLGAAPRAAIQAVVVALVYGAASAPQRVADGGLVSLPYALLDAEYGLLFLLPISVEAPALGRPPNARRDAVSAALVFAAGAVAFVLAPFMWIYSRELFRLGSHPAALSSLREWLPVYRDQPGYVADQALGGLVFVAPALARIRRARPRAVLVASLGGAVLTGLLRFAVFDAGAGAAVKLVPAILSEVRYLTGAALAVSLGGAFADKLVPRLEARLDPARPSAPR